MEKRGTWGGVLGVVSALLLAAGPQLRAAPIPFPHQRVSYDLQHQSLKDFLQRLFGDLDLPVILSPAVQDEPGTLNGPRSGSAEEVFKGIAESNTLVGYYDGSVTYLYKKQELSSRYFDIDPGRGEAFKEATIGFGLTDANDTLQLQAGTGVVVARGTPRFLQQLAQLSSALGRMRAQAAVAPEPPPMPMTLKFFSLKYAWAADTAFSVGNQQTVMPGVATVLAQLIARNQGVIATVGGPTTQSTTQNGLRGRGLNALNARVNGDPYGAGTAAPGAPGTAPGAPPAGTMSGPYGAPSAGAAAAATSGYQGGSPAFSAITDQQAESPRIVADPYRNAVIVRDYPDRMALYEELIRQLDVEKPIIQLDATVIDIDQTRARTLGINWNYQNGKTGGSFLSDSPSIDAAGNLAGGFFNTIIGNSSNFLAHINALEQIGVSKIVEKPQVVTLNDVEAIIESTESLYIPVSGAYDEDLYDVVAGTVLRVTPHLIIDGARQRIRLLVSVEDGNVTLTNAALQTPTATANNGTTTSLSQQSIPEVTRNAVNTQAIIDAGQGLLLGGLVRHTETRTVNQVPFLGSIPLLGRLFKGENVQRESDERLFLISPQIVAGMGPIGSPTASAAVTTLPIPNELLP